MKTYEEINEIAKMEEVGMRRNAGDQINTAFVHGFKNGEKLGHQEGYQQGLEDGKRQGVAIDGDKRYWDGYHAAQDDGRKIYQKGYEDGARCQDEVQYQKGLNDAWDAVRKLDDSLTYDELYNIFDGNCYRILDRFSASEVIEKIRAYEEKQKDKIDIKVGTEEDEKQKRDCDNDKEWDSDSEACANSPCDLCRFNPPGSGDGKPCTMCPAVGRTD